MKRPGLAPLAAAGVAFLLAVAPEPVQADQPKDETEALVAEHPMIGEPAPPIGLKSVDGKSVSLKSFRGKKYVVLHFAASW